MMAHPWHTLLISRLCVEACAHLRLHALLQLCSNNELMHDATVHDSRRRCTREMVQSRAATAVAHSIMIPYRMTAKFQ